MKYDFFEPATEEMIDTCKKQVFKEFNIKELPEDLLKEWLVSNGFRGDNVEFYSTHEVIERNETFEVQTFAPGYIAIANDSGSRVALLKAERSGRIVFLNYMGDMSIVSMESTNMVLRDWIKNGCLFDFDEEREYSAIEEVRIQMDKLPSGGMKDIVRIKKILALDISLGELKSMTMSLPCVLCTMSYIKGLKAANEINKIERCVSLWSDDNPNKKMPLNYSF